MHPRQAEHIINAYGSALVDSEGMVAKPQSLLPCSIGKIKYAFYVYTAALIHEEALTKGVYESLVTSYGWLCAFLPDEVAEAANQLQHTDPQQYARRSAEIMAELVKTSEELRDYIRECYQQSAAT
jgi:hypothetical protein